MSYQFSAVHDKRAFERVLVLHTSRVSTKMRHNLVVFTSVPQPGKQGSLSQRRPSSRKEKTKKIQVVVFFFFHF